MNEKLDRIIKSQEAIHETLEDHGQRLDNLNHIRSRGATAGATAGGAILVITGVYSFFRSKYQWLP